MEKPNTVTEGTTGHYGILRQNGVYVGGFIHWGIGGWKGVWKATGKKWWLNVKVDGMCDASFYRMVDDKEVLVVTEKVRLVYGNNTKNQLIKSLIEMYKE